MAASAQSVQDCFILGHYDLLDKGAVVKDLDRAIRIYGTKILTSSDSNSSINLHVLCCFGKVKVIYPAILGNRYL